MKIRLFFLIILLATRCILGWFSVSHYEFGRRIKVSGVMIKKTQKVTECIMQISQFLFSSKNICAVNVGDRITVIGTLDNRVIDVLGGKLWLRNAKIDESSFGLVLQNTAEYSGDYFEYFRNNLNFRLNKFVPNPEAGLISGIVLGNKKDISQKFYREMINSGTIHIAVASGYNIMLVGGTLLSFLFWFLRRNYATVLAITFMGIYALIAGAEPPVVRSWWMASVLFVGLAIGRVGASWWALTLASWMMLMIDPTLIVNVSFQLSVAASIGLICVEPWFSRMMQQKMGSKIMESLNGLGIVTTISTMLITVPILWWHFGRMSLIGILSNTLLLPLVPMLMVLGVGVLLVPWVFWLPAYIVAHWMVEVIRFLGN